MNPRHAQPRFLFPVIATSLLFWLGLATGGPAAAFAQEHPVAPAVVEPPCAADASDAPAATNQGAFEVRVDNSRLSILAPRPPGACLLGSLELPGPVTARVSSRTTAYFSSRSAELWVVDLRQPAQPRLLQRLPTICPMTDLVLATQDDELVAKSPTQQAVRFDVSDPHRVTVSPTSLRAACQEPAWSGSAGPGRSAAQVSYSRRRGQELFGAGLGVFAGTYLPLLIGNALTHPVNGWYFLPGSPIALGIDLIDKTAKCNGLYCGFGGAFAGLSIAWGAAQLAALSLGVAGVVIWAR